MDLGGDYWKFKLINVGIACIGLHCFFAFSVVLHLMLLLLILPATLSTNHSKHVETSYIVLKLTFSVHNIS
jgi:hypothetical protein